MTRTGGTPVERTTWKPSSQAISAFYATRRRVRTNADLRSHRRVRLLAIQSSESESEQRTFELDRRASSGAGALCIPHQIKTL